MLTKIINTIKRIQQKRYRRLFLSFLFAVYIASIFNIHLLISDKLNISLSYILPIVVSLTFIGFVFAITKVTFLIYVVVISVFSAIFFLINLFYGLEVNMSLIMAILNTNAREASEQTSILLVSLVILLTAIPTSVMFLLKFKFYNFKAIFSNHNLKFHAKAAGGLLLLLIASYVLYPREILYKKNQLLPKLSVFLPLNTKYAPVNFLQPAIKYKLISSGKYSYEDLNKFNFSFANAKKTKEPLIVVLIIGEAARNKSFSLGGYSRNNNPKLSTLKNLVYYNNFTSCNTGTIASVTCLLSYKDSKNFRDNLDYNLKNNVESIIDVFNLAQFNTNLFTTSSYRPSDPIALRFITAKNIEYLSANKLSTHARDEIIIPAFTNFINKLELDKNTKNQFIAVHTFGSHYKYSVRYSKDFEHFTPVCHTIPGKTLEQCSIEEIVNEYDNTILYTDYVLYEIIKTLQNKNAILIYTSDHGESLGEDNVFYHGIPFDDAPKEQTNIPGMIWFSDKYLSYYGKDIMQIAKSKSHLKLDHGSIWHSLASCSFIQANDNIIKDELSFCKK